MLKDDLKKLGLRVRARPAPKPAEKPAENPAWADQPLNEDSDTGERWHDGKTLSHAGLAIVDDDGPANAPIRPNPKGLRVGYNPYESGMLAKQDRKKKVDLAQLSRMIELQRKMKGKKSD